MWVLLFLLGCFCFVCVHQHVDAKRPHPLFNEVVACINRGKQRNRMSIAQEQKTLRAAFKNHGEVVRFKEGRPSVFYTPHQLKDGWVNPPTHKSQSGQYATHLQSETPRENQFYKNCQAGCQKKSTEKTLLRVFCEVSWKGNEHLEKKLHRAHSG